MPHVMLNPEWQADSFRRTIRLKKGRPTQFQFDRNAPIELAAEEIEALKNDIGKAVVPVEIAENGRPKVLDFRLVTHEPVAAG